MLNSLYILVLWCCFASVLHANDVLKPESGRLLKSNLIQANVSRIKIKLLQVSQNALQQKFSLDIARALAEDPSRFRVYGLLVSSANSGGLLTFDILPRISYLGGQANTPAILSQEFLRQFYNFRGSLLSVGDVTFSMDLTYFPIIDNSIINNLCGDSIFREICFNGIVLLPNELMTSNSNLILLLEIGLPIVLVLIILIFIFRKQVKVWTSKVSGYIFEMISQTEPIEVETKNVVIAQSVALTNILPTNLHSASKVASASSRELKEEMFSTNYTPSVFIDIPQVKL